MMDMKQYVIFTDNSTLVPGEIEEGDLYVKEGHNPDGYEGEPETIELKSREELIAFANEHTGDFVLKVSL